MRSLYCTLSLLTAICICTNCSKQTELSPDSPEEDKIIYEEKTNIIAGSLIVKFDDGLTAEIEASASPEGTINPLRVKSLASHLISIDVKSMERLFPHAGVFEERTRAAGLHKWYVLKYDEAVSTRSAKGILIKLPGVEEIELPHRIAPVGNPEVVSYLEPGKTVVKSASDAVFNDPMLEQQWHYYNDGSANSAVSGCDINVVPVWKKYTTGSPEVIVGIVDGGIDFKHEDLAANMWNNPQETGDRKYGFNFVTGGPRVTADEHGTHVAGTIAAVNNNGVGVCGIAGGNAAAGQTGIKLMSCQIFEGDKSGNGAEAIKWSADHGAVISQNSWGYPEVTATPKYLKDAVDYFVNYAGIDEHGNQVGPLKGGVVIFAAGNDNKTVGYPAEYEPIVAVSSVGADYRRAYYSNYGDWTDIAAPGGDVKKGNQVLSTLPGNKYGKMQGTSMACPHVSGIAALIVSKYGGPGFTPEALKQRLLEYTTDISGFNKSVNLGKGLANAYRSIAGSGGKAPQTPTELKAAAKSNNIDVSVKVPLDEDDDVPYSIIIYYGDNEDVSKNEMFAMLYVGDARAGETISGTISGLEFEKEYYFSAVANDLAANKSGYSETVRLMTGANSKPVIRNMSGDKLSLKAHQTAEFSYETYDPDGHFINFELKSSCPAAVLDTLDKAKPKIRITGVAAPSGSYTAELVITDIYGAYSSTVAEYTILENHAPYAAKKFEDVIFDSKSAETLTLKADEYFRDDDGESLSYEIELSNSSVLNFTHSKGNFHLTTMNYGYCEITVTGTDIRGESTSQSFRVLVKDGSEDIDVYPNPVIDKMYLRTGDEYEVAYKLISVTGQTMIEGKELISPFNPHELKLKALPAGRYKLSLSYNGKDMSKDIVKL